MVKKILAALLAAAMVFALVACNSTPAGNDTTAAPEETKATEETKEDTTAAPAEEDTTAEPAAETDAPSGDKVKITIFRCLYNLSVVDDAQVKKVQDKLNQMLDEKGSNVEVEIKEIHNSEYSDKASLALANNEINLLWNSSWWGGGIGCDDVWRAGAAYDITDLLPGTALWDSMPEAVWEASKYDGKVLFIPVYKETYEGYDMKTTQYAIDQTGHDPEFPEVQAGADWYEKMAAFGTFLGECKDAGIKYPYLSSVFYYRIALDDYDFFTGSNALCCVDRKTGEVVEGVATEGYRKWCKLMGDWADAGYIHEDCIAKAVPSGVSQTEDWGLQFWTNVPGDSEKNSEERDGIDEVLILGLTDWYTHSTTTLGSCYTVTSNCTEEQAKACIEFLGYIYTDPAFGDVYTFGIEGEDYTIDANGRVHKEEGCKYNHAAWESTSVAGLTLLDSEPEDKIESYDKNNNAAKTSIAAGFRFDKTPVEAQYAACNDLYSQYGEPLELGAYPASEVDAVVDEYLAKLDAAGYQDVLAEAQKQYKEWSESK